MAQIAPAFASIDARGEGALHHVFPRSPAEYDRAYADHSALGLEPALSFTIQGMGRNVFFDAKATLGCFIELLEFGQDACDAILLPIYGAHVGWEGVRPMRSMDDPTAG